MPLWGNEDKITPTMLNNLIKGLDRENINSKRAEEREKKAEEREKKAEERERKAEERKQLMIKQMEVQSQLTNSINELLVAVNDLEIMLRSQAGSTNPAQESNTSTGIVES